MKRARPKNKKQAMKKLKQEEINRVEQRNKEHSEEKNTYKEKNKKQAKKKPAKVLLIILLAIIIIILAVMGLGLFDESDILAPLEDGKINVLMLGVDEEGLRTDAIMVASYDVNEAVVNMLSIPRDTKVYVTNKKATKKINSIHAMSSKKKSGEILGAEATAEAVTQLTGIPINYYVEFSFSAIDNLFDTLGPVEFDVPDVEGKGQGMNYDDPYQNLAIHLKPGIQKLSGNQVQQFLRYRKSNSGAGTGSDVDRVARQQDFVKAVVDQKVNAALLVKLPSIYAQLSREIRTNISVGDITKYVRYLNKLTGESIHTYSLPAEPKTIGGGSYMVCNLDKTKQLMSETFGYNEEISDKITLSEKSSQKILKAGNMKKGQDAPKDEPTKNPTVEPQKEDKATKAPEKDLKGDSNKASTKPSAAPTKEPTKAPKVTKAPTKAPAVTKEPLEEIEDFDEEIDLDEE